MKYFSRLVVGVCIYLTIPETLIFFLTRKERKSITFLSEVKKNKTEVTV